MEARTLVPGTIGWAVAGLLRGAKLRRAGWPPGVWLGYVDPPAEPGPVLPLADPLLLAAGPPPGVRRRRQCPPGSPLHSTLVLHDRAGAVAGYAVRQPDLLALDWEQVP